MRTRILSIVICIACMLSCTQFKRDNPADPNGINFIKPLPPVSGLRIVAISFNYVDIAWDPYQDAAYYVVRRYNAPGGQEQMSETDSLTGYVDHSVDPSTRYFYRITAVLNGNTHTPLSEPLEVVTSPAPPIHIGFPTGGEIFAVGNPITVEWRVYDVAIAAVKIEVSTDGGSTWSGLFIDPIERNIRDRNWIPRQQDVSDACRIRVVAAANPSVGDTTGMFRIVP